jgi:UDP-glucose 4-epimerase
MERENEKYRSSRNMESSSSDEMRSSESYIFNLGSGHGSSVLEVIRAMEQVEYLIYLSFIM